MRTALPITPDRLLLSVVVPCYNEAEVLGECHRRLGAALVNVNGSYEIVCVDDGSKDQTAQVIETLSASDPHVVGVLLSRNFGHQTAVSAGLEQARGKAVVIIDADLQDPPELIPEMVKIWREGFDVVYGKRTVRRGESSFKLLTARLFYRVINRLSDVDIPEEAGDFRLLDRRVVDAVLRMPERQRLLRAMYCWVGFRQYALPYERAERFAGKTKYPIRKMISLALNGVVSFSAAPLRLVTIAGFCTAALAFLGIVGSLAVRMFTHSWVRGWVTLLIGILFLGGVQLISLGIVGEYIGRIYTEVKQRPLYLIRAVLRHSAENDAPVQGAEQQVDPAVLNSHLASTYPSQQPDYERLHARG